MKKITVVGGGNAGCFTALYCGFNSRKNNDIEVELIHDPNVPQEKVGQATTLDPPGLLWATTGFNWYNNKINATYKSGILYEGWGQINDKVMHPFPGDHMGMHYCPWEMQKSVIESGHFKVTESNVLDPNNIDADYIFDCRGTPKDFSEYYDLINPINACILGKPKWDTTKAYWSRHVATPDGWTFVIPTYPESPSHDYCVGYCYNSNITKKEVAEFNFLNQFDVEVTKHIKFKNYVAKEPVIDGRIFLNGNRLFFLEPMESSSTQSYLEVAKAFFDYYLPGKVNLNQIKTNTTQYMKECQNFILWHYQAGSKYNTPFWDYAKSLTFEIDERFNRYVIWSSENDNYDTLPDQYGGLGGKELYGQWPAYSFRNWYEGMNIKLNT